MFKFKTRKVRELEQQIESLERTVAAQTRRYSKLLFDSDAAQGKLREELEEAAVSLEERDLLCQKFQDERDASMDQLAATQKLLSELREECHLLHQKAKEAADQRRTCQTRTEALEHFIYRAKATLGGELEEHLAKLSSEQS